MEIDHYMTVSNAREERFESFLFLLLQNLFFLLFVLFVLFVFFFFLGTACPLVLNYSINKKGVFIYKEKKLWNVYNFHLMLSRKDSAMESNSFVVVYAHQGC